ncbi:MAG: glycosyltransferase family 39 protein [Microgenomates group bacterium]
MWIFLILCFSLIFRLINLNQSLWLDEAISALVARDLMLREIISNFSKGDFHPPAYYLLLHFWGKIFGWSEMSIRIPSVLFGIGTIYLIYKIGGKNWGLISALFLATSQFHIYYSQEARMYAMACFLATFSMYWWIKILKNAKRKTQNAKLQFRFQIFYLIFTLLLIYTDYYGFLLILSQFLGGLIIFRKNLKNYLSQFLPIYLGIFIFYLPWVSVIVQQVKEGLAGTQNLPEWKAVVNLNFWKALPLTFVKFTLGRITIFNKKIYALVILGLLGLVGGIESWGIYKNYKSDKYKLILIWFLLPVLVAWLFSLKIPNYQPFRLILVLPAFLLILSKGILAIKNKKLKLGIIGLILGINVLAVFTYWTNSYFWREDWRGVAEYLKKEKIPIVISSSAFNWPLVYYGVEKQVIGVVEEAREIKEEDKIGLIGMIGQISKQKIAYTPYLTDVYDRERKILRWLEEEGFVKIKEVSFNQIPLLVYENRN